MTDRMRTGGAGDEGALSVKASDAYHHGDLRAGLIAAAREALETTAPEAITLKSLAVRLGVSQPAPYRHFSSREALLAAVAADGFARFGQAMSAAVADGDPRGWFERSCLAYLAFGRDNRGLYRLMFASHLVSSAGDTGLGDAAGAAFAMLLQGLARQLPPERVEAVAVWVWSTLHGMVMLEGDRLVCGPQQNIEPARVVEEMVRTLGLHP